jgi:hypothetical protein
VTLPFDHNAHLSASDQLHQHRMAESARLFQQRMALLEHSHQQRAAATYAKAAQLAIASHQQGGVDAVYNAARNFLQRRGDPSDPEFIQNVARHLRQQGHHNLAAVHDAALQDCESQ